MSSGSGARRATGLLLASLVLTLSQPRRAHEPVGQVHARQLAQVDPADESREGVGWSAAPPLLGPPLNVSGTYRGTWKKQQFDEGFGSSFLTQEAGMLVFKFTSTPSFRPGVHNVQGELVLRDGFYATEADVLLRVQGVYVVDVGKVMGVLEPATPITLPYVPKDALHLPDYRQALRQAATSWLALPDKASRYQQVPGAGSGAARYCQFSMEFALHHANRTHQQQQQQQMRQQQGESSAGLLDNHLEYDSAASKASRGVEDSVVNGTIISSNCGVVLGVNATTTHIEAYYAKAVNYTVMITALAFAQIMLLVRQMEASSTQALASKVSLLTIAQQAVLDAYLCLLHLTVGIMVEPLFNSFATAAFCEFVIFAIFEMRFLLSVWRARRNGSLDPWTAQRELSILYGRFYGALLGGILLSYYLQRFMKVAVFLLYSFWIPQIVLCVRTDCRQPLKPLYVVGMSLTRLALPLYLYSCPKNLLRVAPSPAVCVGLVAFVGAQVGILLWQYYKGPRCFIPKRFLPPKYDYHRPCTLSKDRSACNACDIETGDGAVECVICFNPVDITSLPQRMVTPCDHFFHPHCLERWMNVKLECPTCRRVLPPL